MGTKKRKNRWAHDGRGAHEISKKNGRQKMKKTMGSAPFLQIHFFRAHDPGIPTQKKNCEVKYSNIFVS